MTSNAGSQDLNLSDFKPVPKLVTRETKVAKPRFPVIDAHNHLSLEGFGGWDKRPVAELLDILDAADVRVYVDLDGGWGEDILETHLDHFKAAAPERFRVYGGVDLVEVGGTRRPLRRMGGGSAAQAGSARRAGLENLETVGTDRARSERQAGRGGRSPARSGLGGRRRVEAARSPSTSPIPPPSSTRWTLTTNVGKNWQPTPIGSSPARPSRPS